LISDLEEEHRHPTKWKPFTDDQSPTPYSTNRDDGSVHRCNYGVHQVPTSGRRMDMYDAMCMSSTDCSLSWSSRRSTRVFCSGDNCLLRGSCLQTMRTRSPLYCFIHAEITSGACS